MAKSVSIEWHFFEDTQADDTAWQQVCASSNSDLAPVVARKWWHGRLGSELALVVMITVTLLWIHPWQRPAPTPKPNAAKLQQLVTLETHFFRINYRQQDATAVKIVATNLDSRYTRLRHTFGLAASPVAGRLTINVGISPEASTGLTPVDLVQCRDKGKVLLRCQATGQPVRPGEEFTVSASVMTQSGHPGPAAQLAGLVQDWMMGHVFDQAVQRTTIQPTWQPLVGGLRHYFWLKQQNKQLWQLYQNDPELWQLMQTLPLQTALPYDLEYRTQSYQWASAEFKVALNADVLRHVVTGSLADYLVSTYGRERLVLLVDGFSHHTSWEKLSPAVFGISARQLEEGWHRHLENLPSASTATQSVELVRYQLNTNDVTVGLTR